MSSETTSTGPGSASKALPAFHPVLHQPKVAQSAPDSQRRHSLPVHFLPPNLWNANTSKASLVESETAARGEHILLDEATVAHRISALRQLNGSTRSRHQYAKSTGARNSTYNQPVIVRTYSGPPRPLSHRRSIITIYNQKSGMSGIMAGNTELKLPPIEAFSFKGIMDDIKHSVAEDLERIAEICARSRYSLSNQYEAHMPPHGRDGEPAVVTIGVGPHVAGPTLQAIGSDDEQSRPSVRGSRGGRRTRSTAYGTLETIMSSSRSSDEDKAKKKPGAVLAEEVRGRAAKQEEESKAKGDSVESVTESHILPIKPTKHVRSKSASFASMVIVSAQNFKHDSFAHLVSPTSLISEPAQPQTSLTTDLESVPELDPADVEISPTFDSVMPAQPTMSQNESKASTLGPGMGRRPSILATFGSWLPWSNTRPVTSAGPVPDEPVSKVHGRMRSASHAEGSLRDLLKSTDLDRKGKGIDRGG